MFKKHLRRFASRQTSVNRNVSIRRRIVKNHGDVTHPRNLNI